MDQDLEGMDAFYSGACGPTQCGTDVVSAGDGIGSAIGRAYYGGVGLCEVLNELGDVVLVVGFGK